MASMSPEFGGAAEQELFAAVNLAFTEAGVTLPDAEMYIPAEPEAISIIAGLVKTDRETYVPGRQGRLDPADPYYAPGILCVFPPDEQTDA